MNSQQCEILESVYGLPNLQHIYAFTFTIKRNNINQGIKIMINILLKLSSTMFEYPVMLNLLLNGLAISEVYNELVNLFMWISLLLIFQPIVKQLFESKFGLRSLYHHSNNKL